MLILGQKVTFFVLITRVNTRALSSGNVYKLTSLNCIEGNIDQKVKHTGLRWAHLKRKGEGVDGKVDDHIQIVGTKLGNGR